MRVRASRPNFWIGQTYDQWTGQDWLQSADPVDGNHVVKLESGSPFAIPLAQDQVAGEASGAVDIQTFYLAESGPNLVFHADNAERVYVESKSLYLTGDGTIVSSTSMGPGTIYTVVSADNSATAAQLEAATVPASPVGVGHGRAPLRTGEPLPPAAPPLSPGGGARRCDHRGYGRARRRRPPHLRQGRGHRAVDVLPHPLHDRHPTPGPGCRRGGQLPVRIPARLLRADLDRDGGHAAHPRDPRPRGGRLRPGFLRPDHRPLRRPGQGCPRLGAGLVPGVRLAELRPHRRRAARQSVARLGAGPQRRAVPRRAALDPPRSGRGPGRGSGARRPPPAAAPAHLGAPGGCRPRLAAEHASDCHGSDTRP